MTGGGGGKGVLLLPSTECKKPTVRKKQLIGECAMTDVKEA